MLTPLINNPITPQRSRRLIAIPLSRLLIDIWQLAPRCAAGDVEIE